MSARKLLVLSYYFPPDEAVGGLRWAGLSRHLAALGWNVRVLTAHSTVAPPGGGVSIETCAPNRTVGAWLLAVRDLWRRLVRSARTTPDATPSSPPAGSGIGSALRRELRSLLWVANEGRGWVLPAAWRARTLISEFQPDVIVSTGPPHGAHLAAWIGTRGHRIPWLVDLRDPFVRPLGTAWRDTELWRGRLGPRVAARLEQVWMRAATSVVAVTRKAATGLAEVYQDTRIFWIPNGVDRELLPTRAADAFPGLAVAHVGSVYGGRKLGTVLSALRRFVDRHPGVDGQLSLRLVGLIEAEKADELRRDVEALRLEPWVHVLGRLPRDEALRVLSRSRLAIVLAQNQEYQVPAKLYEPVAMGVATVVVAEPDSAAGTEARRIGAFPVAPDDVSGMAAILEAVWNDPAHRAPDPGPEGAVDYQQLATQVDALLTSHLA